MLATSSLPLLGNEPKLLHDAQVVVPFPLLGYLASFDAVYGDALDLYVIARGRAKLLYLSLVSTAYRPASDDLVTLGDHILDAAAQVGKGS
jgi:hypothetical protein